MGQFSETHISQTIRSISCYVESFICKDKICEFDRNWPSGYIDMGVENGELEVPVNNTLVYHTAFLASDTRSYVLQLSYKVMMSIHACMQVTHE